MEHIPKHILYIYAARYLAEDIQIWINTYKHCGYKPAYIQKIILDKKDELEELIREADKNIKIYDPTFDGGSVRNEKCIQNAYEKLREFYEHA